MSDEETETAAGLAERVAALEALAGRGLVRLDARHDELRARVFGELRRLRDELRDLAQRVAELEAAAHDDFGLVALLADEGGTREPAPRETGR